MGFGGDKVPGFKICLGFGIYTNNFSNHLMTYYLRRLDVALCPGNPVINSYIRAADGGVFYLDEDFVFVRFWDRDFFNDYACFGPLLDNRKHIGGKIH
jgi:hypothetical protein